MAIYWWDLFTASDPGTFLDLSSVESINAGYDQNSNDINRQRITASDGATIDLSGVQTITGPSYVYDWIEFNVSDDASINLDNVDAINTSSRGRTHFNVTNGASLSLPNLVTARNVIFNLSVGGEAYVNGIEAIDYSSITLTANNGSYTVATYWWDLFTASGPGTFLDLSAVESINAGYDQNSNDINRQRITVSDGATIDLSGVQTITGPSYVYDWIEFNVEGGLLVLGNLNPEGNTYVNVTAKTNSEASDLEDKGDIISGEVRVFGDLGPNGPREATVTGLYSDPATGILDVKGNVVLDNPTTLVLSNATLKVGGDLQFSLTDEEKFKAADSIVHFDGSGCQLFEVGGLDVDIYVEYLPNDNFGFGQLIVGQEGQPTVVRLRDAWDNGNGFACSGEREALYLGLGAIDPNGLRILGGSTLILDGVNLYALEEGEWVHINSLFQPDENEIEYDGGFIQKGVAPCECDLNHDGRCDMQDWLLFGEDWGRTDCHAPGVDPCECDVNNDGRCDMQDWLCFGVDWGRIDCPICEYIQEQTIDTGAQSK